MQEIKKSRTSDEFPIDRLSDLPDCLIHHILSLLDLKTAIQTCILSKRWNNLWTSLTKLNFDSHSFHKLTPFKKFVLNVLTKCKGNGLFSLRFCQTSKDQSFIHRVLKYAMSHGVQEVSLQDHYGLHITYFLFSCKSLRTLELQNCKLAENYFFDSLSRCVSLENLKMIACSVDCGQTIKISSPRLVSLTLASIKLPGENYELKLSAPRLSSFFYHGGGHHLALSMHGCPILEQMGIWLQVPSKNLHHNAGVHYSNVKSLLQEVCFHANVVQVRLDSWAAISIIHDNLVGAQIYDKKTKGPGEFFVWNLQRQLLIHTNSIDSQRLSAELSGKLLDRDAN